MNGGGFVSTYVTEVQEKDRIVHGLTLNTIGHKKDFGNMKDGGFMINAVEFLIFKGVPHAIREVCLFKGTSEEQNVRIATKELESKLFEKEIVNGYVETNYDKYISKEAERLDEEIAFYVDDNMIGIPENMLVDYLENNWV